MTHALSRREMLAGSAGLSFAFAFGVPSLFGEGTASAQAGGRLNGYVTIATDGTITITSPALEMGQGVSTALPLIIFNWARQPTEEFRMLSSAAIIVLLLIILVLNAAAILLRNRFERRW